MQYLKPPLGKRLREGGNYGAPLFAPYLREYLENLKIQRFFLSTIYQVLRWMIYFQNYLNHRDVEDLRELTQSHYAAFLVHIRSRFNQGWRRSISKVYFQDIQSKIQKFLEFAWARSWLPSWWPKPQETTSSAIPPMLFKDYLEYGRLHRGYRSLSLKRHRKVILQFGLFLDQRGISNVESITLSDVDAYLFERAPRYSRQTLFLITGVLRSFLGYLFLIGKIQIDLANRLMTPRLFRQEHRPRYIPWNQVQAFLQNIDRNKAAGKRDYVIAVLLARYGLRLREVATLRLEDVDWKEKRLILKERKDGRMAVFPLMDDVAAALKDYLKNGRPSVIHPEIFIKSIAPYTC
jgi:site-specific recombinase XerD